MGGRLSAVVMAVMTESMLMQRLVKLTTKLIEPIWAKDVFALDMSIKGIHTILGLGDHILEALLLKYTSVLLR